LTPLFAGREEITKSILGDLVGIYDKAFARFTGTRGRVSYNSCFSWIACITPKAIQHHQRYIAEMGSRLLYYRLPSLSTKDQKEGLELILKEKKRSEKVYRYQLLCSSYAHILLNCELPTIDDLTTAQIEQIQTLADLLSRGRAIISDGVQIEEPFRIASQLKELVICLALVHVSETVTNHEMELARQVVLSTIPQGRASVLALFQNPANLTPQGGLTIKRCAKETGITDKGAEGLLKGLMNLTIIERDGSRKEHEYRPLPKFAKIIAEPLISLDHIADLTGGGVMSTIDETSEATQPFENTTEISQKC